MTPHDPLRDRADAAAWADQPAGSASSSAERSESASDEDAHDLLIEELLADVEQTTAALEMSLMVPGATPEQQALCHELAQDIAIGALLNRDNPGWDPEDPSTHRPRQDDPLLALLADWAAKSQEQDQAVSEGGLA